jgi:NADH:ubiquinone oxidoreductase subunit 6 (subunit J)
MIVGLAGLVAWGLSRFQSFMAAVKVSGTPGTTAYTTAYNQAITNVLHEVYIEIFAVAAALMLIGVIPALLLWRRNQATAQGEPHYESFVAPLG